MKERYINFRNALQHTLTDIARMSLGLSFASTIVVPLITIHPFLLLLLSLPFSLLPFILNPVRAHIPALRWLNKNNTHNTPNMLVNVTLPALQGGRRMSTCRAPQVLGQTLSHHNNAFRLAPMHSGQLGRHLGSTVGLEVIQTRRERL